MLSPIQSSAGHTIACAATLSRNPLSAIVNWFTNGTQTRHFVMAVTPAARLTAAPSESRRLVAVQNRTSGNKKLRGEVGLFSSIPPLA
jgi:hypothetical protein